MKNVSTIIDLGANKGQNLSYYFLKSDLVIAVEANTYLCEEMKNKYKNEVKSGKLIIVNAAIIDSDEIQRTKFYINKANSVLSQIDPPNTMEQFVLVEIEAISINKLLKKYLPQYADLLYIKSDLEGFDDRIMRQINSKKVHPKFMSIEIQSFNSVAELILGSKFNSFKLIEGNAVKFDYKDVNIISKDNMSHKFSFEDHSAGPMWEDINDRSYHPWEMIKLISIIGPGWRDLHATYDPDIKIPISSKLNFYYIAFKIVKIIQMIPNHLKFRILLRAYNCIKQD